MSNHEVTVLWELSSGDFLRGTYSRAHSWRFDGGVTLPASPSPSVVRVPYSDPSAVDPEEAFVASLASCHMLWFLSIAARRGFVVDRYEDAATGELGPDAEGRQAMTRVTLRPRVVFSGGTTPTDEEVDAMHHEAHQECYIANSVKTEVVLEPARY